MVNAKHSKCSWTQYWSNKLKAYAILFPGGITGRDRKSYDILSWQKFNYGNSNSETRHDQKALSLQGLFET
jgi:hypothetical protein